ncbi:MAG: hypothetical protein H6867_02015 [Rhodospirillales bacterium]|nr:hypothetical protein [Rhodospirillales bacterium]MCB9996963.1 hypothetical protein [Rhodospirillales bacterium]
MKNIAIQAWRFFSGTARQKSPGRKPGVFVLLLFCVPLAALTAFLVPNSAYSACANCPCVINQHNITRSHITSQHGFGFFLTDPEGLALVTPHVCERGAGTRGWIGYEMCRHREEFFVFYFWKEHVLAAMMMMTEQLVTGAMNQMFIVGSFFDAKEQLETQELFQKLDAQAHRDYHPSFGMCEIGTMSRSLGASQRRGEYNAYLLSQHMQDRQMRTYNMGSSAGKGYEIVNRWTDFKETFCNPHDNDNKMMPPRSDTAICGGAPFEKRNADVDYTRAIEHPLTIEADFSNGGLEPDEDVIFGLSDNLFGHDVFEYFPEAFFKQDDYEDEYMYVRSMIAKRSVAQNSFSNIVGMKSQGKPESAVVRDYMEKLLEQLGVTDAGDRRNIVHDLPSYYAQMEMLTKKLYQRPEFYTNLYDKPVNVDRKIAAMKAIGLMQNMDLFKSKLRSEASLAVLTEMEIFKAQESGAQDRLTGADSTGIQ